MDPWVKGIDAITLFVDDVAVAKQFYSKVFGLPLHFEDPDGNYFQLMTPIEM